MKIVIVVVWVCMGLVKIFLRMIVKSYINVLEFFLSGENSYTYKWKKKLFLEEGLNFLMEYFDYICWNVIFIYCVVSFVVVK